MTELAEGGSGAADLRRQADKTAPGDAVRSPEAFEGLSPEAVRRVIQELQAHQIELEMQNEELRRTQEALDSARQGYFDLYDLAPVGYVTVSEPGLITQANLTAAGMLREVRAGLIHQPLSRFILKEDQDLYYRHRKQLHAAGGPQAWELRMVRKDGTPFWAYLQAGIAQDASGAPVCRLVLSDVTRRKRAEATSSSSEQELVLAQQISRIGSWRLEIAEGAHAWSGSAELLRLYGHPPGTALTMETWLDRVHPEDRERTLADWSAALKGEGPRQWDFRIVVNEQVKWLHAEIQLHSDAGGRLLAVTGINQDITEQKRMEASLREARALVEAVVESTPDMIWSVDAEGFRFLSFNRSLSEYFLRDRGIRLRVGMGLEDIFPPGPQIEQWRHFYRRAVRDGPFSEDHVASAGTRMLSLRFNLLKRGEMVTGISVFGRDITDARKAEAALRESEERNQALLRAIPDLIFLFGREGEYLTVSAKDPSMLVNTPEALLKGKVTEFLPRPLAERFLESIATTLETNAVQELEYPLTISGRETWFEARLAPGGGECVLAVVRDVSQRKQAEATLRKSQAMLARTEALSNIGSWEWDVASGTVRWSDEMFRMVQRDPERGAPAFADQHEIYHSEDFKRLEELVETALNEGEPYELELRLYRGDGEERICHARGYPELDSEGKVAGLFGSLQDITERKQGAERQRRLEAQLQQAQKMESLGILVAGVAHNINNVLSVIMGTASLREGVVTEPSDLEAYQIIGKVCRRGRDVMKSLIRFAKPGLTLQAPFELHALIQEVCALLAKTTGDRVKIVVALSEAPIWIDGDAGSINHVLVNLCINAMEAMPNGGILTLRTAIPEEGWAEVAIEDNGTGMAPEVLAHVLEPFYTTKEVGKGTGLGLSMTYGVVTAHGGTIDIASQPGQGTTVALRFPRIPAPARLEGEGSSGDQVPFSPGALRIFLVDDDEDVRFLMTRLLKKAGVPHVETFTGGEAVLQRLRSGELPDLIILDQNMPEMNGAQAMARIRALRPEMPILVSSGQPDIETLESFRQARVAVISKPFSLEEIQAKLAQFAHETFRDAAEGTEGAV